MYLSGHGPSIRHLQSFLTGYNLGQTSPDDSGLLDGFTAWVCTYYGVPEGAMCWSGHLSQQAGGDERAAFDLFFQHLGPYLDDVASIGVVGIRARLTERDLNTLPRK